MANGDSNRTTAWLGFLQSLVWPLTVLLILLLYRSDVREFLGRTSGSVPGPAASH